MNKKVKLFILVLIIAGSFFAGYWANRGSGSAETAVRKILYYVDPMNPGFRSEKPGIAPCGMPLEPVYAEPGADGTAAQKALPPGSVRISAEKQQLIGVRTAIVEKSPWTHTLRVLGRVALDETRVYRINAAAAGLIKNALPITTGTFVRENELLATFYSSLEYRALVQSYFNSMKLSKSGSWNTDAERSHPQFSKAQLAQMKKTARDQGQTGETSQIDYYRRNILNYGISAYQLAEIERTGTIPEEIEIRSPARGFVVLRNVTADLRFDKGAELYRVADLSRVWVLADVFENEASFFQPGRRVKMELPYQKKTLYATTSNVLPQFDPATRTLKIRLETNNPGYALRPDMFVNVELAVSGPPAILVPVDAVLDSGLKKTVFIDRGNGIFEPRQVETGRSLAERVEIVQGLMPGEKIVVSGNFLIDSETRMQQAASGIIGKVVRDPVCGMNTNEDHARTAGHFHKYNGKEYYFCSNECQSEFIKSPERYTKITADQGSLPLSSMPKGTPKTKKIKTEVMMNHQGHDHADMQESAGASPMPMQSKEKKDHPANSRKIMPMDESAMTGEKKNPMPSSNLSVPMMTESPGGKLPSAAGSPMQMPSGGANKGAMIPGTPGAPLPFPTGNPAQTGMPDAMPSEVKTNKKFSPAIDPSAVLPAPGAAMNALPPAAPDASSNASEAIRDPRDQKKRLPARMRIKTPSGGAKIAVPREAASTPNENEANDPRNISPAKDGQMKPAGGE